jgi:hypothetical protein
LDSMSQRGQSFSHIQSVTWWHPLKYLTYQELLCL